jgi:hypothetical protein
MAYAAAMPTLSKGLLETLDAKASANAAVFPLIGWTAVANFTSILGTIVLVPDSEQLASAAI